MAAPNCLVERVLIVAPFQLSVFCSFIQQIRKDFSDLGFFP
jgi:hypothetical protein